MWPGAENGAVGKTLQHGKTTFTRGRGWVQTMCSFKILSAPAGDSNKCKVCELKKSFTNYLKWHISQAYNDNANNIGQEKLGQLWAQLVGWIGASSSKKPLLVDISNKCEVCHLKTTFRDHLKKHNDKEHNELELYSTKIDLLKEWSSCENTKTADLTDWGILAFSFS